MLKLAVTEHFKMDMKRLQKRGYDMELLNSFVDKLQIDEPMPKKRMDHGLMGSYRGLRELHINMDWLLIYRISSKGNLLILCRMGTHSDLFIR